MSYQLSHFFEWGLVPDSLLDFTLSEFADCGMENLVLMHQWSERSIDEPEFLEKLKSAAETFRLGFSGAHAPFGDKWDIGIDSRYADAMIEKQGQALRNAAKLGIDSMTFHVRTGNFDAAVGQLRALIPAASSSGVVIAVENGDDVNDFALLNRLIAAADSPWVGGCLDTGHANMGAFAAGITLADLIRTPEVRKFSGRIVVVHVHDNHGAKDEHLLAGDGAIDWEVVAPYLRALPRLRSLQNECAAFRCHTSMLRQAIVFRRLFRGL